MRKDAVSVSVIGLLCSRQYHRANRKRKLTLEGLFSSVDLFLQLITYVKRSCLRFFKSYLRNIQRYLESEKIDLDEFAKVTFVSSIDFQHGTVCASFRFENQIIEFEMFLNSFTSTKGELNATSIYCLKQESANYLFNLNNIPNTTSLNMPITGQTESGGGLVTIIKKNEINSCFFLER